MENKCMFIGVDILLGVRNSEHGIRIWCVLFHRPRIVYNIINRNTHCISVF